MPLKNRLIRRLSKQKAGRGDLPIDSPLRAAYTCRAKIAVFDSEEAAQAELDRLISERGYDPSTRPFACSHCRRWHIGRLRKDNAS